MKEVYLSILVVNCKDYKPSHNWYLRKNDSCFYGAAKESDKFWHDELKLKEYEDPRVAFPGEMYHLAGL